MLKLYKEFGDFMRLRKIKGATDEVNASKYIISNPKDFKGKMDNK